MCLNDHLGCTCHQGRKQATCSPAQCKLRKHAESSVLCRCRSVLGNWNLHVVISCSQLNHFLAKKSCYQQLSALRCTLHNARKVRALTCLFILSMSACGGVPRILWILLIWSSSLFPNAHSPPNAMLFRHPETQVHLVRGDRIQCPRR